VSVSIALIALGIVAFYIWRNGGKSVGDTGDHPIDNDEDKNRAGSGGDSFQNDVGKTGDGAENVQTESASPVEMQAEPEESEMPGEPEKGQTVQDSKEEKMSQEQGETRKEAQT
jgi:hypothetical protein